jgi:hypothetical protein
MDPFTIYRRHICQLLSNTRDPVLQEIETTLGWKSLQDEKTFDSSIMAFKPDDATVDLRVPSMLVHCQCCGSYLEGPIRVQRLIRGRTARRRASRRKAQQKREQERNTPSRSLTMGQNHLQTKFWNDLNNLFQVSDGTCKNMIVQTCSHCGIKRKMKGLLSTTMKPKQKIVVQQTTTNLETKSTKKANSKDIESVLEAPQGGGSSKIVVAKSSVLLPKRVKKKKAAPKSALMEFLSGLNS